MMAGWVGVEKSGRLKKCMAEYTHLDFGSSTLEPDMDFWCL